MARDDAEDDPEYGDDPVDEMLRAAATAASKTDAVWAALEVLARANGDLMLPISKDPEDGHWRPDIGELRARWVERQRSNPKDEWRID